MSWPRPLPPATPASAGLASSQKLRQVALVRAQRRSRQVARRRLAWRWAQHRIGQGVLALLVVVLALEAIGLVWLGWTEAGAPSWQQIHQRVLIAVQAGVQTAMQLLRR